MKSPPKALVMASLIVMALSLAPVAMSEGKTASPLLGRWVLDTSSMSTPAAQRPKSVTFTFGDAGGDKLAVQVDIVYAPGQEVHSASTVALDGTPAVVENSPEADHVSLKRPTPSVLVMALQKGGVLVSTRIYSVTPDGTNLVETNVYPGNEGSLVMRTNYFTRLPSSR
jgi:hypothetical protein